MFPRILFLALHFMSWKCLTAAGVLILFSLQGCLMGPDYERPVLEMPGVWKSRDRIEGPDAIRTSVKKLPEADWWGSFQNEELNRLITLALRQNHTAREAAFRVLEGRALVVGATAGLYPRIDLTGSYSRNRRSDSVIATGVGGGPGAFSPTGQEFDIWSSILDLSWEVDLWGRIRRGVEAQTADAEALEHDRRGVILSLLSDVGEAYFRLRELDEQIEIAEKNLQIRQDSLMLIKGRALAGLASELDVKRAEVLVAESSSQIPEFRRLRALAQHRIELLTGSPPDTLAFPARPLREIVTQPEIPIGLPADLLERRPDILQVEQNLIAANARIGEARAFFFPALVITGSSGFQSSEFANWLKSGSKVYSIGPSITLPIFLGGTNVARLDAAESFYEQMLERYQQTILAAFREVADLLVSIHLRSEQMASQHQQVEAARVARELAGIRYREGLVTYLDVLEAERTVLDAELQLVQTERSRLTDMVALFKAVGGGWEA